MAQDNPANDEIQQSAEAQNEGRAANIGDIEEGEGSEVNVQADSNQHSHPKPHNEEGTAQFNGLAFLFQMLSKVVPPKFFDAIFGTSTVGGLLLFAYWIWTEVYSQFPSESITYPSYVVPAVVAAIVGGIYLSVRSESECPQCGTPFAIRRSERELERDKHRDQPDELLIRREESCSTCSYENDEKFWREEQRTPGLAV
ncbi:MAG: hypothetical protein ABEJ88_10015 [Halobacterium sp.]